MKKKSKNDISKIRIFDEMGNLVQKIDSIKKSGTTDSGTMISGNYQVLLIYTGDSDWSVDSLEELEKSSYVKNQDYALYDVEVKDALITKVSATKAIVDGMTTDYFDLITGAMVKGMCEIDGNSYYFDEATGICVQNGFREQDGKRYWYENGVKQGTKGRGKEIYDHASDAWYWLDAVQGGAVATSKDVYQESSGGKWVRYDAEGHMIKGWSYTEWGTYYFDWITGAMQKGWVEIDGSGYYFDENTGILQ